MNARLGATALAAALMMLVPFIQEKEGERLTAYQDVGGVWTICNGETHGVTPGQKVVKEYCRELTKARAAEFMTLVYQELKIPVSPRTLVAHSSFAYNIGINGYRRSQTLKLTNQGDIQGGGNAMLGWYRAGGRDCRIRSNGCYGLVKRREQEVQLCLKGI